MIRTTETASAIHVLVIDLDGKTKTSYELRPPMAAFFDMANTLDHCRNTGLASTEIDTRREPPTKHRQPVKA